MRILVCLDELPTAADALHEACLLAGALPVEIVLLAAADGEVRADEILAQARRALAGARVVAEIKAVGRSLEEAAAAQGQGRMLDLVLVAPAGRRGLTRLLHGSRAVKLVRQAATSIWIARGATPAVRRILVGVSGAPHSEIDVRFAAHLALAFDAEVTALHVISQVPLVFTGLAHLRYNLEQFLGMDLPGAQQLKRAREVLSELGVRGRIEICDGLVRDEIAAEAAQGYDLLVIGAHVSEGVGTLLLDNITEHLLHEAPISTLVVRTEPAWERLNAAH